MRSRRRLLLQLLTALSLLLALATAGLWGRSVSVRDEISHRCLTLTTPDGSAGFDRSIGARSAEGRIMLWASWWVKGYMGRPEYGWRYERFSTVGIEHIKGGFGFGADAKVDPHPRKISFGLVTIAGWKRLQIPHWFLVLLFSLLPAVRGIRWQLRRRRARQLGPDARPCPACGYDRRATPTRCPECGHASDEAGADEPPGDESPSDQAMGRPQEAGR